ncbi:MAG: hypothetical protein EOS56_27265 [Mesorhizobium sp.]|nr:MAG: hypothetical protein EOS56_27265 [Mesorhizobium sp.]RWC65122.1 MAG: hypothetical protein EOS29_10315 [Mesorhizobium sp.]
MGWRDSPPLSCRTSPPHGGRSTVTGAFANHQRRESEASQLPISPLAGEMSGRTEGGVTERDACQFAECPR